MTSVLKINNKNSPEITCLQNDKQKYHVSGTWLLKQVAQQISASKKNLAELGRDFPEVESRGRQENVGEDAKGMKF